ncbi:type II secretion system protein [Bacillus sp. N9]
MKECEKLDMIVNKKGFTLIEVLVVTVILSIIAAIAIPIILNTIEQTKAKICVANSKELEKKYEEHLILDGREHTGPGFAQFIHRFSGEICPVGGVVSYINGTVYCDVHSHEGNEHEEHDDGKDGDSVPYL